PLLHRASVAPYAPDIAMIIVLYVGLTTDYLPGIIIAVCVGLLKDAFSMSVPVGLYMETMLIAFLLTQRLSQRLSVRGPLGVVILTAVFCVGCSLVEVVLCLIFDQDFGVSRGGTGVAFAAMLPQALITAPFGPVGFWLLERIDGFITQPRESGHL
ncbi:MAG: hypothetical protein VX938_10330, partial [Myxococcota bacterium]|nr:hypothetical protein [Myxococcota bacterium]